MIELSADAEAERIVPVYSALGSERAARLLEIDDTLARWARARAA